MANEQQVLTNNLLQACIEGDLELANTLISQGANINYKTKFLVGLLHVASMYNKYNIAQMLIEKGLGVNDKNDNGNTPLHSASANTANRSFDIARMLIENGANVNEINIMGKTPLFFASTYGNLDIARMLIENGANVNIGESPLYAACENNRTEVVKFLLLNGATINFNVNMIKNPEIREILNNWSRSMTAASLNELNVLSGIDPESIQDLSKFMGDKVINFGGKRRNKKSKKRKSRKSKNNKKKIKTIRKRRK
jgi:ankyrin repeat protein